MNEQLKRTKYLRDLRRGMLSGFSQEELKTLAFELSIDWDDFPGDSRPTKVQALIVHFAHRGELESLVELLKEERPRIDWPELPSPDRQIADVETIDPEAGEQGGGDMITVGNSSGSTGVAFGRGATISVTINEMPEAGERAKQELDELIAQLNALLKRIPAEQRRLGEQVALEMELLVSAASSAHPNPTMIKALGEGLKQTGRKLGENLPGVAEMTTKIAAAVAAMTSGD